MIPSEDEDALHPKKPTIPIFTGMLSVIPTTFSFNWDNLGIHHKPLKYSQTYPKSKEVAEKISIPILVQALPHGLTLLCQLQQHHTL